MTTAMRLRLEAVSRRIGITRAAVAAGVLLLTLVVAALLAGRGALGLVALALAGAVIAALAWIVVQHVVAPVRRLVHATEQLASGDLTVRTQRESAVEIDDLAAAFNELVAALEVQRTELVTALDAGARSLRGAEDELARQREATRVKDEFIATISDELHAPLTTMRGFLELALRESAALTAEQRRFVTASLRNSESLLRTVEDLLLVAQIEAGELVLEVGEVDVLDVAAEAVETARAAADEEGVSLEFNTRGVPTVNGDRARLVQLLRNLIANAIAVTPRGGRVEVVAEAVGGIVGLTVRDERAGDATPSHMRVYAVPRAERARVIADGLAIPIAKGVAEAHGGTITVTGATVRVELPA
jgi:signal transduction histidine kinase